MPYDTSEPRTPYHLTKSEDRSQPYLYEGHVASRYGWLLHRLVVFVTKPGDAERLRHSVPGMRVDRVAPLKVARVTMHMQGDEVTQVTYDRAEAP